MEEERHLSNDGIFLYHLVITPHFFSPWCPDAFKSTPVGSEVERMSQSINDEKLNKFISTPLDTRLHLFGVNVIFLFSILSLFLVRFDV